MAAPEGVEVVGEFKRITVTWVAPEGAEPDYVVVNVKKVSECGGRLVGEGGMLLVERTGQGIHEG